MKALVKKEHGFTVVELIVVIIVIAILVTVSVVSYTVIIDRAREQEVVSGVQKVASKLTSYKANNGNYPENLSPLNLSSEKIIYTYLYNANTKIYCLSGALSNKQVSVRSNAPEAQQGGCS